MTEQIKQNNKIKYSSLYCLKAFGALCIIFIHSYNPFYLYPIIRTAVPLFFMISGYFLYSEDSEIAQRKCIKAFKKILWITIYANLFYYISLNIPNDLFPINSLKSVVHLITVGTSLGYQLWYLNAYIQALVVIIIALKFKKISFLWKCIPIFLILGLMTGKYQFLVPFLRNSLSLSRNFITMGIPFVGIGWLIRKYGSQLLSKFSSKVIFAFLIIVLILSESEVCYFRFNRIFLHGDYVITTIPLVALMLLVAIKYPLLGKNSLVEVIGKKYSLSIYIFHIFVLEVFKIINNDFLHLRLMTFPFIIFILTLMFSIVWEKCSKKFYQFEAS